MIKELLKDMPDLLTTNDLVALGLYSTDKAAYFARRRKISSPPYIRIGKRILYPKAELESFLARGGIAGTENSGKGPDSWQGGKLKMSKKDKALRESASE